MAADQQILQPDIATEHPASPQVQRQASQETINLLWGDGHFEVKEERFIDHEMLGLKDDQEEATDDFTSLSGAPSLQQTNIFLHGQKLNLVSVPFGQGLELEPPYTPFIQESLQSFHEFVTPETVAAQVSCDRPGGSLSSKHMVDLTRHGKEQRIYASHTCSVGSNKVLPRKGSIHERERSLHYSEAPSSQKKLQTTVSQNENKALALNWNRIQNVRPRPPPWSPDLTRQGLHNDLIRLKPAIEDGYGDSEDLHTTSDGFSIPDSVSTRSTSSRRTIASKSGTKLCSAGQVGETSHHKKQFACPFRKKDRHKYNARMYKTCAMSGWTSVARVKEHIYRRHKAPPQCRRCWAQFKTHEGLEKHSRVIEPCEIRQRSHVEGVSVEIEKRLKLKRRDQSEDMRWEEMYRLLFPNSNVPSPYFESLEDFVSPEGFNPPDASSSASNEIENTKPPNSIDSASCFRDEFLRSFNIRLRDGLPTLGDGLRSELVSIAAECHDRSITEFAKVNASKQDVIVPSTPDEYMDIDFSDFPEWGPGSHPLELTLQDFEDLDSYCQEL